METPLNNKQRKFLEYIQIHSMSAVLADWDLLCGGSIDSRVGYGTPIKYLKR